MTEERAGYDVAMTGERMTFVVKHTLSSSYLVSLLYLHLLIFIFKKNPGPTQRAILVEELSVRTNLEINQMVKLG